MFKITKKQSQKARSITLLLLTVILTISTTFNLSKLDVSAHNSYFVAITFDDSSKRLNAIVTNEDNDLLANNHLEADVGDFSSKTVGKEWTLPDIPTSQENKKEDYYKDYVDKGNGDKGLVFTFPGVHGRGCFGACTEKVDANGEDERLANTYAENVVGGLNEALNFIEEEAGSDGKSEEIRAFVVTLANAVEGGSGSVSYKGSTFSLERDVAPKMKTDLLQNDDYVKITSNSTHKSIIVPYKMNKGYQGDNIYRKTSDGYVADLKKYNDPEEIGWKYAVLQANYNKDIKNVTFSSVSKITKPNQLEISLSGMLSSAIGVIRQLLGLYPMQELMLNDGARSQSYYYGIMPNSWKTSSTMLYVVCLLIAGALLMGAIVKILINKSLSTINVTQKISMMEGFKNLIATCFLLSFFPFVFYLMAKLNYSLVELFGNSSNFSSYIGTTNTMSSGLLGTVIISIAFFIVDVYFNFVYVLRAVTIAILYGIAPLAIVSLAFGGKSKMMFGNFTKQLVGNIFIQTFHAICVSFFTNVTSTSSMKTFELLVVFYSLIPLTKFIKSQIFGLDGGITDEAGGLLDTVRGVSTGVVGGVVGGAIVNKNQGGGGRSSSGTGSESMNKAIGNSNGGGKLSKLTSKNQDNKDLLGDDFNGNSRAIEGTSRTVASSGLSNAGKIAKGVGKSVVGAGLTAMASGASLGLASTGDRRGSQQMAGLAGMSAGYTASRISQPISDARQMSKAGIKNVYEDGGSLTYKLDADRNGNFSDENINNSSYADNIRDVHNAFAGQGIYEGNEELQTMAKAHYTNQGVNGVGVSKDGYLAINVDKDKFSRHGANFDSLGKLQKFDSTKVILQQRRRQ